MPGDKLYLIDAMAFCYRAFYALRGLSTSFGQPTNAVYGFTNMLNKILKENKPEYLGVCFDVSRDTFRAKKFKEYKIQRSPMPDGLSGQIPLIKEVISAYGIAIFEKEGFEADDIIATIARQAKKRGLFTVIISSDKDILQLVDDYTVVFSPYKNEGVTYDQKKVEQRFGVKPQGITDILSLMGDDADNIPGVAGIGEKTAIELIAGFGSLEALLNNTGKIKQDKIKKAILDNIGRINLNKQLTVLDQGVDIDFDLGKLKIGKPDFKELHRLFRRLEFKRLLEDLPAEQKGKNELKLIEAEAEEFRSAVKEGGKLVLYGLSCDNLIFSAGNIFFKAGISEEPLRALLADPSIKKMGHDLKKIKISLAGKGIALEGLYFDTMLAAYLLNPSKPDYSLKEVAYDYLGISLGNNVIDELKGVSLISQLVPKLEKELCEKSLFNLFSGLEMPLVEVLAEMETNGIKLDLTLLEKLSRDIEKRLIKLKEDIYGLSGCQFNINSPKQLREVLFERLKLPVVKKSKTGPSTNEEVLRKLADKHELPRLLLEYRQLMKLKTNYIDTLPGLVDKKTGRIHASFNQTGTETGRLSSSNPNLQNIPIKTDIGRNIRRAIVAPDTASFILSCDYSQIELRILAHLSGDRNLLRAFKEDKDIHKATASLIYGLEERDILDPMREAAKRVNFGIIYGLTSYGLSRDLNLALEEAEKFIEAYFLRYPQVKEYINLQVKRAQECGFVTTILGRRRYIPEINSKNQFIRQFAERQAVNTPIQGSASDLIKLAMVGIHNQIRQRRLKAKMAIQIHDELVFDVPGEDLNELTELVRERMENVLKLDVPVKVDIKKGKNWLEMEPVK